jgi:hypothetical protein
MVCFQPPEAREVTSASPLDVFSFTSLTRASSVHVGVPPMPAAQRYSFISPPSFTDMAHSPWRPRRRA